MAVYNAEQYLRRCLDSLLAQTLSDFDVIFVDDGSTDKSLSIAKEYAEKDCRFRVYHKANGGVSSARQYGIDCLAVRCGKYSIHLDPDDWVEPQMLQKLYRKAEETEADMVICDYYMNYKHKQKIIRQNPGSSNPERVLGALFQRLHGSLCNKLIRSACYREFGIRFPEGLNYSEDYITNVQLLLHISKVAYLPEAFYHYDQYSNQLPATRNEDCKRIDITRTEVVRRCRQMVPARLKNWQYQLFEVNNAADIMKEGGMADAEFKQFFADIPLSLLLHHHRHYFSTLLLLLAIHTPLRRIDASRIHRLYMNFRRHITLSAFVFQPTNKK